MLRCSTPPSPTLDEKCHVESVCVFKYLSNDGSGQLSLGSRGEKMTAFFSSFGFIILEASSNLLPDSKRQ